MDRYPNSQQAHPKGENPIQPSLEAQGKTSHGMTRWYPIVLLAVTFGIYFQNVYHEFTYDDQWRVLGNPIVWKGDWQAIWDQTLNLYWMRQIRTITFMVDYSLYGFSSAGFHLHNLFWHMLCVILVFLLLKKVTHHASFSFLGSLLFALHPIQVEAVSNITNRKEMLALAFLLIAFLCYIRFLEGQSAGKWMWLGLGSLSWILAIFSKQVGIMLPPLLVTYELLLVPKRQRFLSKNLGLLIGLVLAGSLPLFLYAIFMLDVLNFKESAAIAPLLKGYRGELTYMALLATSARAFWSYIFLLVWPSGLCPNHVVDLSPSFFEIRALLAWAGLIGLLVFTLGIASRWPILAFGMLWFMISFIPISNWVPSAYILADRYMYMPSVGYCIIVVALAREWYRRVLPIYPRQAIKVISALSAVLLLGYTGTTLAYNQYWSNEETLLSYMLQCNPLSSQAYNGLGISYLKKGQYAKAAQNFTHAIEMGNEHAYSNRGSAYFYLGKYEAAIKDFSNVIRLKPKWERPYNNRGTVYYELGDYEAALKDYHQAMTLMPQWGEPYFNRGILYLAQKNYVGAVEDFTRALDGVTDPSRVYNARGLAYEKLNNSTKAEKDYRKAISIDPSNGEAYFNLGRIQLRRDELKAAIASYQKSKELGWEKADAVLQVLRKKGYL